MAGAYSGERPSGVLNWALSAVGLGPVELLYTEWAVVIGSVQVFLPMMVLPLTAAIGRIDPAVEDAARTLGGTSLAVFRRVTLPLSLPGLGVGCTLVFSLTASSFILPALLGGSFTKMLGTLVEEQILTVFDWPFGAAIATVMVMIVMAINLAYMALIERRFRTRATEANVMSENGLGRGAPLIYALSGRHRGLPAAAADPPDRAVDLRHAVRHLPAQGLHPAMVRQGARTSPTSPRPSGFSVLLSTSAAIGAVLLGTPTAVGLVRAVNFPEGPGAGIGAVAADLPHAGDRHRAAAAVLVDRLARCVRQPGRSAMSLVTTPYVVRTVSASLVTGRSRIEEAARTLGADRIIAFWRVTRPQIMPGLIAGALFAFVTSFDNYAVSMWLFDAGHVPLPMMMISLISRMFDPGIAAIASLMIFFSLFMVLVLERLAGLRRAMSF